MKTSGLFGVARHRVKVKSAKKPIKLFPVGDIHYFSNSFDHKTWERFKAYTRECQKEFTCLYILMGDEIEQFSTSERQSLKNAKLHDTARAMLEADAHNRFTDFWREIRYMNSDNGKIVSVLEGNHNYVFDDGTCTSSRVAGFANAPFLGVAGILRLSFEYHGRFKTFDIAMHHGVGAGKRRGASMNALEDMQVIFDADMYLQGHNHDKCAVPGRPIQKAYLNPKTGEMEVRERKLYLGRTGSFTRGYRAGHADYNVDAMRPASPVGWIEWEFRLRTQERNDRKKTKEDKVRHKGIYLEVRGINHD